MTISRAQMYRQLYQNGGNTLPIYPRIEAIENSLGGAEERIGDPALEQFSGSPLSNVYNNQTSGMSSIFGNTGSQQSSAPSPQLGILGIPGQGGFNQPQSQQPQQSNVDVQIGTPLPGVFGPRGPRPFGPQVDPNRDYGFNQYGFDSSLLNYLNQQKQGSFNDMGASYNYDPTTQTFSGGTMGAQYGNIPLSVLQQVATSGDRNLLQQYQTGGRGFNQPQSQQPGVQPIPGPLGNLGPINVDPNLIYDKPRPNFGQQPGMFSLGPINVDPNLIYDKPTVGDPRLGAPFIPGNPLQEIMRGRAANGGRIGYQEGGMEMMQPEGIMGAMSGAMSPEAGGMMQPPMQDQMQGQMMPAAGGEEQGQNALLTIIQLLIEQGIDPETAKELAARILEAFAQGGEPAVEALANQLEQEEGMQQPMMMAEGGLTSIDRARDMLQSRAPRGEFLAYINPQEAGILKLMGGAGQDVNVKGVPSYFKKIFKSVAKAVKSVAKSPIGMIALSIAAPYALGALTGGAFATFGGTGLAGAAIRAGISNLAIQGITTGKFDPKQALIAGLAGGALSGLTGPASAAVNIDPSTGLPIDSITGTITQPSIGSLQSNLGQQFNPSITPSITGTITQPSSFFSPTEYGSALSKALPTGLESDISSMVGTGKYAPFTLDKATLDPAAGAGSQIYNPGAVQTTPNIFERGLTSVQDFGTKLISDPIGTIGTGIKSTYDLAKKYPAEAILAATAALGALTPQQPGEPDDSYQQRKTQYDAEVARYITQYGGGTKLYSPSFYAMEGAVDPFAGRSTYAADGGSISFERKTLEKKGYGDMMKNMTPKEVSQLYDSVMGTFSRRFQAEGSMPMGEPRQNQAGIMELDYRAKGGFVPPIGIKEKADDIPAMLSNNEFVFTADAVRNAGEGNVNKGAQRMYGLMKQLEAGGVV
jgi:hypothetical protein